MREEQAARRQACLLARSYPSTFRVYRTPDNDHWVRLSQDVEDEVDGVSLTHIVGYKDGQEERREEGKQHFKPGDVIAYGLRDLIGDVLVMGRVVGYLKGDKADWVALQTVDGVAVAIPQRIPVLVPVAWADTLTIIDG